MKEEKDQPPKKTNQKTCNYFILIVYRYFFFEVEASKLFESKTSK